LRCGFTQTFEASLTFRNFPFTAFDNLVRVQRLDCELMADAPTMWLGAARHTLREGIGKKKQIPQTSGRPLRKPERRKMVGPSLGMTTAPW
jgi:hypothetical protein